MSLLDHQRLSAHFKPGQSALGHHWILMDGDEQPVGRTKLYYEGAGKTLGRMMRATGLSTAGTIHATIRDASGEDRFRVVSKNKGSEPRLDLEDARGTPVGSAMRKELSLDLLAPPSDTPVGRIVRETKEDMAFAIEDARGERVAVLSKRPVKTVMPSIYDMIVMPEVTSNQIAFAATMYLGFAGSREYHLVVEQQGLLDPLRTLVALSPVIAAYAY
jgi:hypothetical protein